MKKFLTIFMMALSLSGCAVFKAKQQFVGQDVYICSKTSIDYSLDKKNFHLQILDIIKFPVYQYMKIAY